MEHTDGTYRWKHAYAFRWSMQMDATDGAYKMEHADVYAHDTWILFVPTITLKALTDATFISLRATDLHYRS